MSEISFPFNVAPGNVMNELTWAQMMRYVLGTGVFPVVFKSEFNALAVTPSSGLSVNVDTGAAWIQGFYYQNDATKNLTFSANTNPSGTRADLVVLECKWGVSAGITAKVVEGVAGTVWSSGYGSLTGKPKPASLQQDYGVLWQIALAQVNISYNASSVLASNITDMRNFVYFGTPRSSTYTIAANDASPLMRANADAIIPAAYVNAEDIINVAIALVYTTYGGGTITLSEGTFKTGNSILGKGNVNLQGQGNKTSIELQATAGAVPVIYLSGESDVTIRDLSISGGATAFTPYTPQAIVSGSNGIQFDNGANIRIKDVKISGCKDSGIFMNTSGSLDLSYGHRIEGCSISGNYNAAIITSSNASTISDNQLFGNLKGIILTGVSLSVGASLNIIKGNIIRNNSQGALYLTGLTGYQVTRNEIIGNAFQSNGIQSDNAYPQITLYGTSCKNNFLNGNMVMSLGGLYNYMPSYGIYLDTTVSLNSVTQNECLDAAKTATHNIGCGRAASSNASPNWIRFNHSGSVAPDGSSYDA